MSCLLCSTYYFNQGIPLPRQTKRIVFRDCPFPINIVNKKLQDVLLLYTHLIGINVIIIIKLVRSAFLCDTQIIDSSLSNEQRYRLMTEKSRGRVSAL